MVSDTLKLDIDITDDDDFDKFLDVMKNTAGTFDDFIKQVKLHGAFDATNPAEIQSTMNRVDNYVQELENRWGFKMEDVKVHVNQGKYVLEQMGRTPTPEPEETPIDRNTFGDIITEGVTKLLPGGGLVTAFKNLGFLGGIAMSIVSLLTFVKGMFQHSQIMNRYSETFMKVFGHFADLIMIAFLPLLNQALIFLITKVRPVVNDFSKWLGENQGLAAAIGAAVLAGVMWRAIPNFITSAVVAGMAWLLPKIGALVLGRSLAGRLGGGRLGGVGRGVAGAGAVAGIGALGFMGWQMFDSEDEGWLPNWMEFGEGGGEGEEMDAASLQQSITDAVGSSVSESMGSVISQFPDWFGVGGGEAGQPAQGNIPTWFDGAEQVNLVDLAGREETPTFGENVATAGQGGGFLNFSEADLNFENPLSGRSSPLNFGGQGGNGVAATDTTFAQSEEGIEVNQNFNTNIYVSGVELDEVIRTINESEPLARANRSVGGGSLS